MIMDSSSAVFAVYRMPHSLFVYLYVVILPSHVVVRTSSMSAGDVFRVPSVPYTWWAYTVLAAFGFSVGLVGMVLHPLCGPVRHCL